MKAAVVPAMSSSWQIKDVPQPQPGPGQVLVKMHASGKATLDVTNLIWQRASIQSFVLFDQPQAAWAEAWNAIVPLLQSGAIKPIVAKTFPLAKAALPG